jgi:hypothetical protein
MRASATPAPSATVVFPVCGRLVETERFDLKSCGMKDFSVVA